MIYGDQGQYDINMNGDICGEDKPRQGSHSTRPKAHLKAKSPVRPKWAKSILGGPIMAKVILWLILGVKCLIM